jgi:hypothetical protein
VATQSELYSLALAQGLDPYRAKIAAAIAMAESGGNPRAHNTDTSTGDNSYGLWQINMLGEMGPERRKKYGLSSNDQLFDPETNARAMKGESGSGTNWTPWTTYTSSDPEKSYRRFMDVPVEDKTKDPLWKDILKALSPAYAVGSSAGGVGGTITDVGQGIGSIVETVNKSAAWLSNSENWVRVGYVVGGSVMIIVGLVTMISSTTVGKAAMNLVPAGRVANLAKKGIS